MGIFNKIKNILFEDDEEGEMPVYTKEDEQSVNSDEREEMPKRSSVMPDESINETREVRFKAPKAEMDYRDDILDEVGKKEEMEMPKVAPKKEEPPVKETRSPFLSFDEEEFERLNSRIVSNEKAARSERALQDEKKQEEIRREEKRLEEKRLEEKRQEELRREEMRRLDLNQLQRKANNNVSATNPTRDTSRGNPDRYKIEESSGKKPFKPSPVISPVYGILDKNYKVDDIVDKKDGIKREISKPPVREEISYEMETTHVEIEEEEEKVVNIDSVRNKAFGIIDKMEKEAVKKIEEEEMEKELPVETHEEVEIDIPVIPMDVEEAEDEDDYEEEYVVSNNENTDNSLDDLVSEHFDNIEEEDEEEVEDVPRALDDLEKTSTLQILDDIEKELNSIKPISKDYDDSDDEESEDDKKDGSLENDLFNLIDSMYEEGEEDSDD